MKTFTYESEEYKKLNMAAELLSYMDIYEYRVADSWLDIDEGIAWTTILRTTKNLAWSWVQAITPAEQKKILQAETIDDLVEMAKRILAEKEAAYNNHVCR